MSLQDLVTENLVQPASEKDPDALEIVLGETAHEEMVYDISQDLLEALEAQDRKEVVRLAELLSLCATEAIASGSYRFRDLATLREIASLPILSQRSCQEKYIDKALQENIVSLRDKLHGEWLAEKQSSYVGNPVSALDYIGNIFGEQTALVVASLNDVTMPTAKKWLSSGRMSWSNGNKIKHLGALLYRIKEDLGWSEEEICSWYKEEIPELGGRSPQDIFDSSSKYTSSNSTDIVALYNHLEIKHIH